MAKQRKGGIPPEAEEARSIITTQGGTFHYLGDDFVGRPSALIGFRGTNTLLVFSDALGLAGLWNGRVVLVRDRVDVTNEVLRIIEDDYRRTWRRAVMTMQIDSGARGMTGVGPDKPRTGTDARGGGL